MCGICQCAPDFFGRKCECDAEHLSFHGDLEAGCRPDNTTTTLCNNRGECVCGKCECHKRSNPTEVSIVIDRRVSGLWRNFSLFLAYIWWFFLQWLVFFWVGKHFILQFFLISFFEQNTEFSLFCIMDPFRWKARSRHLPLIFNCTAEANDVI